MPTRLDQLDVWIPEPGEQLNYEGIEGPIDYDQPPDATNYAIAIRHALGVLATRSTGIGPADDQPAADEDAPLLWVVTDAENGPSVEVNLTNAENGSGWQLLTAGGAGGGGGGVSIDDFETVAQQANEQGERLTQTESLISGLGDDVTKLTNDFGSIRGEFRNIRNNLNVGHQLFQQTENPIEETDQDVVKGDHWIDTSDPSIYREFVLDASGSWIPVAGSGTSSGGTEPDPILVLDATSSIDYRVEGTGLREANDSLEAGSDTIDSTQSVATGSLAGGNATDDFFVGSGTPTVWSTIPNATTATLDGTALTVQALSRRVVIDSFGHQNHSAFYESNNINDWGYSSNTAPGASDGLSIQHDVTDARHLYSPRGGGLDAYPESGRPLRVWTKIRESGGTASLRFAYEGRSLGDEFYEVLINDDLNRFLLYRDGESRSPDRIGGVDNATFSTFEWYLLEAVPFPNGGSDIPIRCYDEDLNILYEDATATDDTGTPLDVDTNGVGVRSGPSTRARFDELHIPE